MVAWLARLATSDEPIESRVALESLGELASRPRRAADVEDALEIRDAMADLLSIARDKGRPNVARIAAIRALRMYADRGWVTQGAIPSDLDARTRTP